MHRSRVIWPITAAGLLILAAGCRPTPTELGSCPITQPNGVAPPGEPDSAYYHTDGGLTTALWPDGVVRVGRDGPGEVRADGSLAMKFPFFRGEGVSGHLVISGQRLDGKAGPAHGEVPDGYGETGFQASAIVFPTVGCWKITARAGEAEMTFVQRVVASTE